MLEQDNYLMLLEKNAKKWKIVNLIFWLLFVALVVTNFILIFSYFAKILEAMQDFIDLGYEDPQVIGQLIAETYTWPALYLLLIGLFGFLSFVGLILAIAFAITSSNNKKKLSQYHLQSALLQRGNNQHLE